MGTIARYRKRYRARFRPYYGRARKFYGSRKGLLKGNIGNIAWGAGLGVVSNFIPNLPILGKWTKPVLFGAGGWILKKPAMLTVAGYEAGKSLFAGSGTNIRVGFEG